MCSPGALAQQGERYNGIVEVVGSNPTCSILPSISVQQRLVFIPAVAITESNKQFAVFEPACCSCQLIDSRICSGGHRDGFHVSAPLRDRTGCTSAVPPHMELDGTGRRWDNSGEDRGGMCGTEELEERGRRDSNPQPPDRQSGTLAS